MLNSLEVRCAELGVRCSWGSWVGDWPEPEAAASSGSDQRVGGLCRVYAAPRDAGSDDETGTSQLWLTAEEMVARRGSLRCGWEAGAADAWQRSVSRGRLLRGVGQSPARAKEV